MQVMKLRRGKSWQQSRMTIDPEESTPLEGIAGAALDIECTFERCRCCPSQLQARWLMTTDLQGNFIYSGRRLTLQHATLPV